MKCISSVFYSILLNGSSYSRINRMRGLRQKDPLSPYLFILGMKVFLQMLLKVEKDGKIRGAKTVSKGSIISHIFCADR